MKCERYRLLLIEDDPDERFFLEKAFSAALGDRGSVHLVNDGEEAIAYMIGEGPFHDRNRYPFPSFISIDLRMPKKDGFAVLEFLKSNPAWNVIPRIILTSSDDDDDVKKAYVIGATAYHRKPSAERMEDFARRLVEYWTTVEVPPSDETGRLQPTQSIGKLGEHIAEPQGGRKMERPLGP